MIGIEAAFLIGGLIVTETVFNIPGVARFLVEAIRWRDYPIVQNLVMFIAVVVVSINFLIDMLYAVLDPRIRYAELTHGEHRSSSRRPAADIDRAEGVWSKIRPPRRARYPLGAVGAVIMLVFVFAAVFADLITAYRSDHRPIRAISLLPPGHGTSARRRFHGPRHLSAASSTARASRSRSASARPCSAACSASRSG